jgi:hypothetical protein
MSSRLLATKLEQPMGGTSLQGRAIRLLSTTRPDLFAFEVSGRIREADIERMALILTDAFDEFDEVDILIVMRDWDGIEFGAVFDWASIKAQARANRHVRKYAVVGAPAWAEAMIRMFSPLTPVEEKTFDLTEEGAAWAWVDGNARDKSL